VKVFDGKPPAARADELVSGTNLSDPTERKKLVEGGAKAVEASQDAIIRLALLVDPESRRLRKGLATEIEEGERRAYARTARWRFEAFGRDVGPDATFGLRLAFGVVRGYRVEGEDLLFATTFGGAFERAEQQGHREPFVLPKRWLDGKDKLDLK